MALPAVVCVIFNSRLFLLLIFLSSFSNCLHYTI
nr:MAG TPA: hypothetical protein [Caudoviricetes sp.]